jgi:uncharacterized membrane protein
MTTMEDPKVRYLERFERALTRLHVADRRDVVAEIDAHIADAMSAGRSPDDVLQRLGAPERLARAYMASALFEDDWMRLTLPHLRATALLATTSLASVVIIPTLLVLAGGLVLSGALALAIGIAAFFIGPETLQISPPTYEAAAAALAFGVACVGLGLLAWRGLRAYVPLVARTIRREAAEL